MRQEEAIICFDKSIEINPNYSTPWNNKGTALNVLFRFEEAIYSVDKSLEINPKGLAAWNNKGIIRIKVFQEILQIQNIANSIRELTRYDEATFCYDKANEINCNIAWNWYSKGSNCSKKLIDKKNSENLNVDQIKLTQEFNMALQSYDRAIQLKPADCKYYIAKAKLLEDLLFYNDAILCYNQATNKVIAISIKIYLNFYRK